MKMSCLPEGVNWNNKEFTKEMLDYMRAVYCMHPMVLDALDYIAELETFIDQLIEAGNELTANPAFGNYEEREAAWTKLWLKWKARNELQEL